MVLMPLLLPPKFLWLVLYLAKDVEYWVTLALLPVSMLVLVLGAFAAHKENTWLMVSIYSCLLFFTAIAIHGQADPVVFQTTYAQSCFMILLCGAEGYFIFKTVRMYQQKDDYQLVYKVIILC